MGSLRRAGTTCLRPHQMPATAATRHAAAAAAARPLRAGPNAAGALIDADSTECLKQAPGFPGDLALVFSDEFNTAGRAFGAGARDARWTAVDLWYLPTGDEEAYKPDAVTTRGGRL